MRHISRAAAHILACISHHEGGATAMQDETHDEEFRQNKTPGDVDDLIFYGEVQPGISDR